MKRLVIVLVILMIFSMCGCNKREGVDLVTESISFSADVFYYNEKYSFDAEIDADKALEINFTSPDEIKGLKVTVKDGDVTTEYLGLKYTKQFEKTPLGNVVTVISGILNSTSKNHKTATVNNGNCIIKGEYNGSSFKFTFSPAGLPILIEIPDESFSVEFKNVTII